MNCCQVDNHGYFWSSQPVAWDTGPTSPEFILLATGTAPAAAASLPLRPDARIQRPGHLWDPVWFAIHETFAIPFWFSIGYRIDAARSRLGRTMRLYLCARVIFTVLALFGIARLGAIVQFFFWLVLTLYGLACILARLRIFLRGAAVRT